MRLEDWQKWLDSQFLDEAEAPPQSDSARSITPVQTNPLRDEPPVTAARSIERTEPPAREELDRTPAAPPPAYSAPPPPTAASDYHLVDEVDVPSIERYLPFLRTGADKTESAPSITPDASVEAASEQAVKEEEEKAEVTVSATEHPAADALPEAAVAEEPSASGATEATTADRNPESAENVSANEDDAAQGELEFARELPPVSRFTGGARRIAISRKRVRAARNARTAEHVETVSAEEFWNLVPRHVHSLIAMGSDDVAQNSYKRGFRESRLELIQRLLDPTLSLEETARLLNVCPTTVRRYTNRGLLRHQRTTGDQRRFKLSDVLAFLESQSRAS